jgi:hypothetical protein
MMAKKTMKLFEKSKFDKEPKNGPKEGSKAEEKLDKKQFAKFKKAK